MQQQQPTGISKKITLSYFLIALLAAAAISILYQGIHHIIQIDESVTKPNDKLKKINQILTLVYEAENYSRSYFIYRNDSILKEYINTSNKISNGIDTLKILCNSNNRQVNNLGEIADLLQQKKDIIDQLEDINQNAPQDVSYTRVLDEVYYNTYENFNQPVIVKENTRIKRDSIFEIIEQSGLAGKVKKIFSSEDIPDKKVFKKVSIEETVTYDTLNNSQLSSEIVINTFKKALDNFKTRNEFIHKQFVSQETQLLHSDKIILDRIRALVTSLETEEIEYASRLIAKSQEIIKQSTFSVIILGSLAFAMVLFFLFIIYRDIARSRAYQLELQKARQYSDDLVNLKEQFVANMSHEIRTPLSSIIGFAEQLKKSNANTEQKAYIQNLELASRHLHALVNNVLDLSKSNSGKLTLDKTPFRISDICKEIKSIFSNTATSKGLTFYCTCDQSTETYILGDPFRLKQVIINFVGNAIKFTEEGHVKFECTLHTITENEFEAEIIITDSGIGIQEDKISFIFDEFVQADSKTTRKFGGSGLGLSISKKIIDLMQGNIKVESKIGKGSKFTIVIPFQKSQQDILVNENEFIHTKLFNNAKILIVDDDEPMRLLLRKIFNDWDIKADFADSGDNALSKLTKNTYALVITDIQMPGLSGFDLIKKIHENNNTQIPVIAFTANVSITEKLYRAGFAGYIPKPFTEKELLNCIAENIEKLPEKRVTIPSVKPYDENKEYSLTSLIEFTGDDMKSLRNVLDSFINSTLTDIELIRKSIEEKNLEVIVNKVHKMLPMFRQLKINRLIDKMELIERSKELDLASNDILLFADNFVKNTTQIINKLKSEIEQGTII